MMTVYVKTLGKLAEQAFDETPVALPQGASLQDLLTKLGIKTEDVMLAFINGSTARLSSLLTPECQVHLSPFICGG
jgi:sulfur carrier protein ThiS